MKILNAYGIYFDNGQKKEKICCERTIGKKIALSIKETMFDKYTVNISNEQD